MRHLRPVGKPAPPRPRSAGVLHGLQDRFDVTCAFDALAQGLVTAAVPVGREAHGGRRVRHDLALGQCGAHGPGRGAVDRMSADDRSGRMLAAADAGGGDHPHVRPEFGLQRGQQRVAAGHGARIRVADADRDGGWLVPAFLDHVEVVVEGRHLVDFRGRELHFRGQRREMRSAQAPIAVLDPVQEFDQQVAPPRAVAKKIPDLCHCPRIGHTSFGLPALLAEPLRVDHLFTDCRHAGLLALMTRRHAGLGHGVRHHPGHHPVVCARSAHRPLFLNISYVVYQRVSTRRAQSTTPASPQIRPENRSTSRHTPRGPACAAG